MSRSSSPRDVLGISIIPEDKTTSGEHTANSSPSGPENPAWDSQTFNDGSFLLPSERNGDWRTGAAEALKDPIGTSISLRNSWSWKGLRTKVTGIAEEATAAIETRVNRAFQGKDVPAFHYKVIDMLPHRLPLPTVRQMSRGVDFVTDKFQDVMSSHKSDKFLDEPLVGDHLAFAGHMSKKARRALVIQGICREWQVMPSRETVGWQSKLEGALIEVFHAECTTTSIKLLFGMDPKWKLDANSATWKLELDTKTHNITELPGENVESTTRRLPVPFELPQSYFGLDTTANTKPNVHKARV